jgi:hypothetical protein
MNTNKNYTITGNDWGTPIKEFRGSRNDAIKYLLDLEEVSPGAVVTVSYKTVSVTLDLAQSPDIVTEVMRLQPRYAAIEQARKMTPAERSARAKMAVEARESKKTMEDTA